MTDPPKVRDRQRRLDESLLKGAPHFTPETGASASGGGSFRTTRFRITDLDLLSNTSGDWLICRTWDGTNEGTEDVLIAKPFLVRRTPFDTVAVARIKSPPTGSISGGLLTASGVNWRTAGVVAGDNAQITNVPDDPDGNPIPDGTYPVGIVNEDFVGIGNWTFGDVTGVTFRVGPKGDRLPRNGIEYLYESHTARTGEVIVGQGEDPGAKERQVVTPDYVIGEEVFAIPFPYVGHADDPAGKVLWLAVSNTHAWAQRDV